MSSQPADQHHAAGPHKGCTADLEVLQPRDPAEALRLKATRLAVVKAGRVIARTSVRISELRLAERPGPEDGAEYAPKLG